MGANKEKQNFRYRQIASRIDKKVRYDGFTEEEIKIIKTHEKYEYFEKELNNFWANAPRKDNGAVDWNHMSENELSMFEHINSNKEKCLKKIIKYEEKGFEVEKILDMFVKLNIRSVCY